MTPTANEMPEPTIPIPEWAEACLCGDPLPEGQELCDRCLARLDGDEMDDEPPPSWTELEGSDA